MTKKIIFFVSIFLLLGATHALAFDLVEVEHSTNIGIGLEQGVAISNDFLQSFYAFSGSYTLNERFLLKGAIGVIPRLDNYNYSIEKCFVMIKPSYILLQSPSSNFYAQGMISTLTSKGLLNLGSGFGLEFSQFSYTIRVIVEAGFTTDKMLLLNTGLKIYF